ncbi:MAG: H-NS histone family protein [Mesorhizobium sp.]|uniref:H-NS family nucleoid-associated regulatory protein n=1 Tax=Mesorhizobium sp. TaxID=1871066 RepID=UPI00121FC915|nr:H-NS family nucleoid-associated regulatory protein [Mesorhizobium sp.]TIT32636.1 MAG: H-NS histone family protein [Mesorhizobium sp.]
MAKTSAAKPSYPADFATMSLDELAQLHHHLSRHLEERKQARIKELQAELMSLGATPDGPILVGRGSPARSGGAAKPDTSIQAMSRSKGPAKSAGGFVGNGKATRAKPAPVYRSPDGFEWSGRGAIPRVFKELGVTDKAGMEKYRI